MHLFACRLHTSYRDTLTHPCCLCFSFSRSDSSLLVLHIALSWWRYRICAVIVMTQQNLCTVIVSTSCYLLTQFITVAVLLYKHWFGFLFNVQVLIVSCTNILSLRVIKLLVGALSDDHVIFVYHTVSLTRHNYMYIYVTVAMKVRQLVFAVRHLSRHTYMYDILNTWPDDTQSAHVYLRVKTIYMYFGFSPMVQRFLSWQSRTKCMLSSCF